MLRSQFLCIVTLLSSVGKASGQGMTSAAIVQKMPIAV